MVEQFGQLSDSIVAVLSNGHLVSTPTSDLTWRRILPDVPDIAAVAALIIEGSG